MDRIAQSMLAIFALTLGAYGIWGSIVLDNNIKAYGECSDMWGFDVYSVIYAFLTMIVFLFVAVIYCLEVDDSSVIISAVISFVISQVYGFGIIIWGTIIRYGSDTCIQFYRETYPEILFLYKFSYWGVVCILVLYVLVGIRILFHTLCN